MTETDIFAEMEADALDASTVPSDDKLEGIAKLVDQQIKLEATVLTLEDHLKTAKEDLRRMQTTTLPEAMMAIPLHGWKTPDGLEVSIDPFVSASITQKNKSEAHQWLRDNDFGDLIKTLTSVDTGRDLEQTEVLRKTLVDAGFTPDTKESVHAGTLKAWVREQVTAGTSIPLELFEAFLGQKSTIKKGK